MTFKFLLGTTLAMSMAWTIALHPDAACAQGQQQPEVSVVSLAVQQASNGTQSVVTPRGFLVPLPGGGVNSSVVELYMGRNGGFWYTDRTGKNIDLTAYVQQVRTQTDKWQQAQAPQYAPVAAPVQQQAQAPQYAPVQQQAGASAGQTAVAAGVGAGVGAMMGSAMTNTGYYNHMPYGTPMYYGNNGRPYYNDDRGKEVFVNEDGDMKWNNVYAAKNIKSNNQAQKLDQINQHQQKETLAQSQAMQQRAGAQSQSAPSPEFNREFGQQQRQQYKQQENWYQDQTRDKGRAEKWQKESAGENPFVRESGGRREGGRSRGGERAAARGGGGRSRGGGGGGRRGR